MKSQKRKENSDESLKPKINKEVAFKIKNKFFARATNSE